jgi:putative transposase
MSLPTARFIQGGFKVSQHKVYLAKLGKLKILWSRELPAIQSSVRPNQKFSSSIFPKFCSRSFARSIA